MNLTQKSVFNYIVNIKKVYTIIILIIVFFYYNI
jgi:hypothetical protein